MGADVHQHRVVVADDDSERDPVAHPHRIPRGAGAVHQVERPRFGQDGGVQDEAHVHSLRDGQQRLVLDDLDQQLARHHRGIQGPPEALAGRPVHLHDPLHDLRDAAQQVEVGQGGQGSPADRAPPLVVQLWQGRPGQGDPALDRLQVRGERLAGRDHPPGVNVVGLHQEAPCHQLRRTHVDLCVRVPLLAQALPVGRAPADADHVHRGDELLEADAVQLGLPPWSWIHDAILADLRHCRHSAPSEGDNLSMRVSG